MDHITMTCVQHSSPITDNPYQSLANLNTIPIVNDSVLLVLSYYEWIKSKNTILDSTLSKIERVLKSVKGKTEPIVTESLGFLDITPEEGSKEKVSPDSPPVVTSLSDMFYNTAIEPSIKIATWPFSKTMDLVNKTSSITVCAVSSVAHSSVKMMLPSFLRSTTECVLDKSHQMMDQFLPSEKENLEDPDLDMAPPGMYTKVKRLSSRTQRRLYILAISEINILQKTTMAKLTKLRDLIKDMKGRNVCESESERVIEGCESTFESKVVNSAAPTVTTQKGTQRSSLEMEQLQDLMSAVAGVKKYATTNTLVSLHFINSNLTLLRTVLVVNQKVLNRSVQVIDKIQLLLEYLISKIRVYVKSQKIQTQKYGRRCSFSILDDLDSD